jgi:hypothetical protein
LKDQIQFVEEAKNPLDIDQINPERKQLMKEMLQTFMNARLIMPCLTLDKDFSDCIKEAQLDLIKDILTFNKFLQLKP